MHSLVEHEKSCFYLGARFWYMYLYSQLEISARKHAYIILTPLNPTFI